jgi:hypothetical protein
MNTLNTDGFLPQGAYQNKVNHEELWLENIFKRGQLGGSTRRYKKANFEKWTGFCWLQGPLKLTHYSF